MHTGEWHKLCACVPGWATLQRREALHDESEREEAYAGTAIDRAAVGDDPNTARLPRLAQKDFFLSRRQTMMKTPTHTRTDCDS